MKKNQLVSILCVLIISFILFSPLTVKASSKLSEYDFSDWNLEEQVLEFSSLEDGDSIEKMDFPIEWAYYHHPVAPGGFIVKEGDNALYRNKGYSQLYTVFPIESRYVYSLDVSCAEGQNVGLFVRAGVEKFVYANNRSNFYEQDRSKKNGPASLGGAGMYIQPSGTKVRLFVKLFDEEELCFISKVIYEADAGVDFASGIHRVTFVDDSESVFIYVADELKFQVFFSEVTNYHEVGSEDYYSKVVVKDGEGNELGTHDNAIISTKSVVAVGNRNFTITIEKISLQIDIPPQTPSPEPTDTPEATPESTPKTTDSQTVEPTDKADNDDSDGNRIIYIIIAVLAVVVIAVVIAVITLKKKKKS